MQKYKILQTRTVKEFLWFPRRVKGKLRWLCFIEHSEFLIQVRSTGERKWVKFK